MLEPSSKLKVQRTAHIAENMARTKSLYRRLGLEWVVPASIERAMKLQMPMLRRYHRGDFRHSLEEAQAEEDVGIWLVNQHQRAHGLELVREPTWRSPWLEKKIVRV